MSDLAQVRSFIDGAKTSLDWMTSHNAPEPRHEPTDYERGFRHALDAVGGCLDEIKEAE
ncbi:hypothetical protein [Arthrobacter sp. ISL-95]|uniref:hypothetical protein n=1 Tax=Arthrobacter sp. ISL-95 TaxID=2819116 RepID=UPI001BE7D3AE|nr:hypothetical protein [Arthrobacter sp. ISL-95]MBT2587933.1 hypothetical protein [Arthrobacter sp. ISL-95]